MSRRLPTLSEIGTAMKCLGSIVLRRVETEDTEDATTGQVVHRFLQLAKPPASEEARSAALAEIDDLTTRLRCAAIDLLQIPAGASTEVALGWSIEEDRAEILQLDVHRGYPERPGWLFGTLDLVGGLPRRGVLVGDYKSGISIVAEGNWQLMAGALFAARAVDAVYAKTSMISVGYDGRLFPDHSSLDLIELDDVADALRDLVRRLAAATPETVELRTGPHCRYCPARACCPAQTALVHATAGRLATIEQQLADLTIDQAGEAWQWTYDVAERLDIIRAALKLRVEAGEEAPLPDGRRMKAIKIQSPKKSEKAKAELRALSSELETRGEIWTVPTTQVRPVGRKRA